MSDDDKILEVMGHITGKTYNHAFDMSFEVCGSIHPEGKDITPQQLHDAIVHRAAQLLKDHEMAEHCGAPFDTFEEVMS